jgi:predicted amidohydrolase
LNKASKAWPLNWSIFAKQIPDKVILKDRWMFRLGIIQMLVEGGNKEANLTRAENRIAEAARSGAQVVVLPECLDLGWTHPASETEAEPIPGGAPFERMAKAAAHAGVYVCAGLTERADDLIYNAAVLIDPHGRLRTVHRKVNEMDIGHSFYASGDKLAVVRTDLAAFGVMICSDGFATGQVISRSLCYMGADVILSPCAWAVSDVSRYNDKSPYGAIWRENYKPVADNYRVWIAGVSNVGAVTAGPWAGRTCIGASLVFGADGSEVLQGPFGQDAEAIMYVDVIPVPRPYRGHDWDRKGETTSRAVPRPGQSGRSLIVPGHFQTCR